MIIAKSLIINRHLQTNKLFILSLKVISFWSNCLIYLQQIRKHQRLYLFTTESRLITTQKKKKRQKENEINLVNPSICFRKM